jgi:hypothetical protein
MRYEVVKIPDRDHRVEQEVNMVKTVAATSDRDAAPQVTAFANFTDRADQCSARSKMTRRPNYEDEVGTDPSRLEQAAEDEGLREDVHARPKRDPKCRSTSTGNA